MNSRAKAYFPCLDAIRTFACFFPISTHLLWERWSPHLEAAALPPSAMAALAFVFGNGTFGVRLFMVMSGFLITYLMFQELDVTGGFSVKRFYMRRVLRIWPVYFAVIGYIYLVYPWVKAWSGIQTQVYENPWAYLFFLGNFDFMRTQSTPGIYPNAQISLSWSVSIEEQFYLVWPLLFAWGRVGGIIRAAAGCWLLALAAQVYFAGDPLNWIHNTLPCFLYIASGALLAILFYFRREEIETRLRMLNYPLSVALTLVFFGLLGVLGIVAWLPLFGVGTAAFCCWLMATQIAHQEHPWNLARCAPMVHFSKYTYGLYMYHRIVQWYVLRVFYLLGMRGSPQVLAAANLVTLVLSGLVAYVSFHTFEAYFNRRKHLYSPFRSSGRELVSRTTGKADHRELDSEIPLA